MPITSKNVVLTGFMGAGKSMASNELAKRWNRRVIATDALVELKEGRSISEIFTDSGEDYFREIERQVVQEIAERTDTIVDCGGGIFLNQSNIDALKKNGITIYLSASVDMIHKRTKGLEHRPLLNVEDREKRIEELLTQRAPFYEQADHIIDTNDKTNETVCDEIEALLSNE